MLITLVIIGVVAALTLPTLMTKYQHHVLENQFKKSVATINHALSLMAYEDGGHLRETYTPYDTENKIYPKSREFSEKFWTHIKAQEFTKYYGIYYIKNYNNTSNNNYLQYGTSRKQVRQMLQPADGSLIDVYISAMEINIIVDANGQKGPNRLGYDVFYFIVAKNDTLAGSSKAICNLTDTSDNNGRGCSYYALRNKCPYDDTKTYWECLK